MYVSHTHRFVYLAARKTASRAVAQRLQEQYDAQPVGSHHAYPQLGQYPGYLIFTTVRNPYTWMESLFSHYARKDFRDVPVDDVYTRQLMKAARRSVYRLILTLTKPNYRNYPTQRQLLVSTASRLTALLAYEQLDEHFSQLPFVTQHTPLPVVGRADTHPEANWDKQTLTLFRKHYVGDLDLLSYTARWSYRRYGPVWAKDGPCWNVKTLLEPLL